MTDNSPMLHQDADLSPMLGGDRAPVQCLRCGSMCIRDFFGNAVCLECMHNDEALEALRESPLCPKCGATEFLSAEIVEHWHGEYGGEGEWQQHILNVYCDSCEEYIWMRGGPFEDYSAMAYLQPGGGLDFYA